MEKLTFVRKPGDYLIKSTTYRASNVCAGVHVEVVPRYIFVPEHVVQPTK